MLRLDKIMASPATFMLLYFRHRNSPQLRARNRMLDANVIYRPKTYLIFSPEYRRIWTWPISGTSYGKYFYAFGGISVLEVHGYFVVRPFDIR